MLKASSPPGEREGCYVHVYKNISWPQRDRRRRGLLIRKMYTHCATAIISPIPEKFENFAKTAAFMRLPYSNYLSRPEERLFSSFLPPSLPIPFLKYSPILSLPFPPPPRYRQHISRRKLSQSCVYLRPGHSRPPLKKKRGGKQKHVCIV